MNSDKKNCSEMWKDGELLAYVEGDLDSTRSEYIKKHLARCPECAAETEALRTILYSVSDFPESFHPDDRALYEFIHSGYDPENGVAQHLSSCESCQKTGKLLRAMESEKLPVKVKPLPQKIRSAYDEAYGSGEPSASSKAAPPIKPSRFRRWPIFSMATAAAAVLIISLLVLDFPKEVMLTLDKRQSPQTPSLTPSSGISDLQGPPVGSKGKGAQVFSKSGQSGFAHEIEKSFRKDAPGESRPPSPAKPESMDGQTLKSVPFRLENATTNGERARPGEEMNYKRSEPATLADKRRPDVSPPETQKDLTEKGSVSRSNASEQGKQPQALGAVKKEPVSVLISITSSSERFDPKLYRPPNLPNYNFHYSSGSVRDEASKESEEEPPDFRMELEVQDKGAGVEITAGLTQPNGAVIEDKRSTRPDQVTSQIDDLIKRLLEAASTGN